MSSNEDAKLLVLLQMLNAESVGNILVTADILTTTCLGPQGPLALPPVDQHVHAKKRDDLYTVLYAL